MTRCHAEAYAESLPIRARTAGIIMGEASAASDATFKEAGERMARAIATCPAGT
jgi:hypothetical protein